MNDAKTTASTNVEGAATRQHRATNETVGLGKEIYERDIRRLVEANHFGETVAIDVDSGSWALGESDLGAVDRLREKRPEAVNVFCETVGIPMHIFASCSLRRIV